MSNASPTMRFSRVAYAALIAASLHLCASEPVTPSVQDKLLNTDYHFASENWLLFAATIVDHGNVTATYDTPPEVLLEISEVFRGSLQRGKHSALWRGPQDAGDIDFSEPSVPRKFGDPMRMKAEWAKRTLVMPPVGTKIIAFGGLSWEDKFLRVDAGAVFRDTEGNRSTAQTKLSTDRRELVVQETMILGSIIAAFLAIVLAWRSVKIGARCLALSVVLFILYNRTIPVQMNIRVDLVVLFPLMFIAIVSLLVAVIRKQKRQG